MSTVFGGNDIPLIAAAAQTTTKYHCMYIDSNGKAAVAVAAGQRVDFVSQDTPAAGAVGCYRHSGSTRIVGGAQFAAGVLLTTNAAGRAIAATAAVTKTDDAGAAADPLIGSFIIGTSIDACAGDGSQFGMLLKLGGAAPSTAA